MTTPVQHSSGSTSQSNWASQTKQKIHIGKEKVELTLFADDRIFYIENPKNSTRKLLELIKKLSKVLGFKINT